MFGVFADRDKRFHDALACNRSTRGYETAVSGRFRLGMFGPRLGLSRLGR
jgi:hypothetical protein